MRPLSLAEELEAVLASGSAARRSDILSRVTDLFIYDAARYSPDQVHLFGDVMARLARGMGTEARARLAERLALLEIRFTPSSGVRVTSTCEVASDDGIRNSPRLVLT